jgi:hypothetical protein
MAFGPLMSETLALVSLKSLESKVPVTVSPKATEPKNDKALLALFGTGFKKTVGVAEELSKVKSNGLAGVALFPARSVMLGALRETATNPLAVGLRLKV